MQASETRKIPRYFEPEGERPGYVDWVNRAGPTAHRLGLVGKLFDPDALVWMAQRATGLEDFGPERFRDGLEILLRSASQEARLTATAELALPLQVLRLLSNRLRVQSLLAQRPWIRQRRLPRPIFIVGMPRTGTTLLHRLLARDPRAHAPRLWEMYYPIPPSRRLWESEERYRARLVARVQSKLDAAYAIAPGLRNVHDMAADDPEECHFLLQHTFVSEIFHAEFFVPSYMKWLGSLDGARMEEVYGYHRTLLQILMSRAAGERLVLKYPFHLPHLDVLLRTYPDACIVQTHRDPLEVVPSACNLIAHMRGTCSDRVDLDEVGRDGTELLREALGRAVRSRETMDPSRVFDVSYPSLVRDPIGTVRSIHRHFDLPFDGALEADMRSWMSKNRSSGGAKYSLEQFGLERADIVRDFADYCRKFDVATGTNVARGSDDRRPGVS
jgi:hypothetical protein